MIELLFRDDAYLKSCEAEVLGVTAESGVILNRTVFYATGGGQPGDAGTLIVGGMRLPVINTVYDADKSPVHLLAPGTTAPAPGTRLTAELDWPRRHALMRMHTALHLLLVAVNCPVTGGQIGEGEGRLDFDIAEGTPDKDALTEKINALIRADHPVSSSWITDAELDANPQLIRTLSVKPPRGSGKVRLVAIGQDGAIDLQPCGGTHVRSTAQIGPVAVTKIENKGKINRRIRLAFT